MSSNLEIFISLIASKLSCKDLDLEVSTICFSIPRDLNFFLKNKEKAIEKKVTNKKTIIKTSKL